MGYISYLRGEITFDPPANYAEIRKVEAIPGDYGAENIFTIETEKETRETDEGSVTIITGDTLVCRYDDGIKAYGATQDFKNAIAVLAENPERTFEGYIQMEGEDQGDLTRFTIEDGKAVEKSPQIIW